ETFSPGRESRGARQPSVLEPGVAVEADRRREEALDPARSLGAENQAAPVPARVAREILDGAHVFPEVRDEAERVRERTQVPAALQQVGADERRVLVGGGSSLLGTAAQVGGARR